MITNAMKTRANYSHFSSPLFRVLALAIITFCLTGCETTKYNRKATPGVDLSQYESFAFLPLPEVVRGVNAEEITAAGRLAQSGIKQILEEKGYPLKSPDEADAVINVTGSIVPKILVSQHGYDAMDVSREVDEYGRYTSYYNVADYFGTDIETKEEGTLMIEVYDRSTRQVVWVGWGTRPAARGGPQAANVVEIVQGILASVPKRQS